MKNSISVLFLIFAVVFMHSCEHEPIIPEGFDPDAVQNEEDKECDSSIVYFQQQILPLLRSNCAVPGCHDTPKSQTKNVVLTSYNSLMNSSNAWDNNDALETEFWDVIEDGEMPLPSSGKVLDSLQKNLILEWLKQGAKNNSCENQACDTLNVTYSNQISTILNTHCRGCHSGSSPESGIMLTDYVSVKDVGSFIVNDTSLLMGVISHLAGFPQMPYNQAKLNDCKINTLRIWIEEGMPQ